MVKEHFTKADELIVSIIAILRTVKRGENGRDDIAILARETYKELAKIRDDYEQLEKRDKEKKDQYRELHEAESLVIELYHFIKVESCLQGNENYKRFTEKFKNVERLKKSGLADVYWFY